MERPLFAALILSLAAGAAHADRRCHETSTERLRCCRAIDGDTIRCGREFVRLRNVYAAEMDEPGGPEAKVRMIELLRAGEVTLERHARDRYRRTIAYVFVNGRRIEQADIGPPGGRGLRR